MKKMTSSLPGAAGPTTSAWCAVSAAASATSTCSKVYPVTRLVAVNHDGSQQKKLLQNPFQPSGQINDRIIDWTPEDPRSVLIEKFNPRIGLRVLKLDVYSGETELYENGHTYVGGFGTDGHGKVRLGWGTLPAQELLFRASSRARRSGASWRGSTSLSTRRRLPAHRR